MLLYFFNYVYVVIIVCSNFHDIKKDTHNSEKSVKYSNDIITIVKRKKQEAVLC